MNVPPAVAEALSLNGVREGVIVVKGSLAVNHGVEKGDVLLEVSGAKIATTRDLETAGGQRAPLAPYDCPRRPRCDTEAMGRVRGQTHQD